MQLIFLNQAWCVPLQCLVAMGFVFWLLRYAGFAALGVLIASVPIQSVLSSKMMATMMV